MSEENVVDKLKLVAQQVAELDSEVERACARCVGTVSSTMECSLDEGRRLMLIALLGRHDGYNHVIEWTIRRSISSDALTGQAVVDEGDAAVG